MDCQSGFAWALNWTPAVRRRRRRRLLAPCSLRDFAVVALAVVAAAAAAVACLGERQMELITKYDRRLNVFAVCCLISQIASFFFHFF